MSSSENTVTNLRFRPMPDPKAFDKQPLPDAILAEIITAYNNSVNTNNWRIRTEFGDLRYNLKSKLFAIVGNFPSLDNYDFSNLPQLVREIICEIFDSQFEANSKKRVLLDQKSAYRATKKLNAEAARANAALPAYAPRWTVVHIDRINNSILIAKL